MGRMKTLEERMGKKIAKKRLIKERRLVKKTNSNGEEIEVRAADVE